MTRHTMGSGIRIVVCLAATALLVTGCHVSQPGSPASLPDHAKATEELKALPSLADMKTQVQGAMAEITAAALKVIPTLVWVPVNGETPNGCDAPYDHTDGQNLFLPDLEATGVQVSEADWKTILNAAEEAAAKIGARDKQVMQDGPGNHDVGFFGAAGTSVKIGYQGNLLVSGNTGCRLPQNAKR